MNFLKTNNYAQECIWVCMSACKTSIKHLDMLLILMMDGLSSQRLAHEPFVVWCSSGGCSDTWHQRGAWLDSSLGNHRASTSLSSRKCWHAPATCNHLLSCPSRNPEPTAPADLMWQRNILHGVSGLSQLEPALRSQGLQQYWFSQLRVFNVRFISSKHRTK